MVRSPFSQETIQQKAVCMPTPPLLSWFLSMKLCPRLRPSRLALNRLPRCSQVGYPQVKAHIEVAIPLKFDQMAMSDLSDTPIRSKKGLEKFITLRYLNALRNISNCLKLFAESDDDDLFGHSIQVSI